ncbi:PilZ domain-containing protein [Sphingomonas sp. JC676]|uniref:PilZ domain-containing protein n=1 Tax=Sphingomonas sp. JC676 TaxID=2768065 RepID=UPI0016586C24|nr:PilZ domain-containing protein [Sphingomonas sp. JC676]MBC9031943.1 PilZ domain-containing protein [Sphingomonas sp. JC676]
MEQGLTSATIFSLAADAPIALPIDPDVHAELDTGMLASATDRYACSIRKFSAAGATLSVETELRQGEAMHLELANGQRLEGTIGWSTADEAGFVFDSPIDVIGTLARNLASVPDERRQVPRVELYQTVGIHRGDRIEFVRARNVSQGGVGIEARIDVAVGEPVQITFDGLRPLGGTVRWVRKGLAGIAFDQELSWQVLIPWLRHVQRSPAANTPPATPTVMSQEPESLIPDKQVFRLDSPSRVREGVRWWNVRVRGLTPHLVEFEAHTLFARGAKVWIDIPGIGGTPAKVIETSHNRTLCEFSIPLRLEDLRTLSGGGRQAS